MVIPLGEEDSKTVNIGFQVLLVAALVNAFLIGASFYFIWPFLNIEWATTPPHVAFLWFTSLGWISNFLSVILFWSNSRGSRPGGR